MTLKKAWPNTVICNGRAFSIYTDFRVWIKFETDLVNYHEGDIFRVDYLFKNDVPLTVDIKDLLAFSRPYSELPRKISDSDDDAIPLDWEIDAELIYAAILGQYGIDLFDIEYLHWHKLLAMIKGLNESTKLREVMQYRMYKRENNNKNVDQYERLKSAWEIRRLSSEEEQELEEFNRVFGGE